VFEFLVSADAVVPDYDAAVARCQAEWGLPDVHPNWVSAPQGMGAKWCFARLQRDRRLAPTALEILGIPYQPTTADTRPEGYAFLPEIAVAQGDRPARNHSTVVAAVDLDSVVDRVEAAGGEYRLDGPDGNLAFPRLWIGFTPDRPDVYRPWTDGGIRLEVIPYQPLMMPEAEAEATAAELPGEAPVRITARTILIEDLDAALAALTANLGWEPSVVSEGPGRIRRARFSFPYPRSADLELVQPPAEGSAEAAFLAEWGPGPFSIRVAMGDMDAQRRRLALLGVPAEEVAPALPGEPARLLRPAERGTGAAFEFVPA